MNWSNYWRIGVLIVCVFCIVILLNRFRINHMNWNAKTKDYWYAFLGWSVAGATSMIVGIHNNTHYHVTLITFTAASVITLVGLVRTGSWGSDNKRSD